MYGEQELEFANSQIEWHLEFIELTLKEIYPKKEIRKSSVPASMSELSWLRNTGRDTAHGIPTGTLIKSPAGITHEV